MYLRKLIVGLAALALGQSQALDCAKAKGAVEQAICGDAELKALDAKLGASYGKLRAAMSAGEFAALRSSQLKWLKERDQRCGAKTDCLSEEMQIRINALDSVREQMAADGAGDKAKQEEKVAAERLKKAEQAAAEAKRAAEEEKKARQEELAQAKEEAGGKVEATAESGEDSEDAATKTKAKAKKKPKNSDDGSEEPKASEDDDTGAAVEETSTDDTVKAKKKDEASEDAAVKKVKKKAAASDEVEISDDDEASAGDEASGEAADSAKKPAKKQGAASTKDDASAASKVLKGMKKKGSEGDSDRVLMAAKDQAIKAKASDEKPRKALTSQEIYKLAAKSVVTITAKNSEGESLGSGVVLSKDVVATNCHVTSDGEDIMVHFDGEQYPALASLGNDGLDFCLLFTQGLPATPAPIGALAQVEPGAPVYSIGSPKGLKLTIANGLVSGLKEVEGVEMIQTSAPISHGSSGGGLFNEYGQVIGITTASLADGQNLNFALPAELAIQVAQEAVAAKWAAEDN